MTTIMTASNQWATRPADERYTSLVEMLRHFADQRRNSRQVVVSSRVINAMPVEDEGQHKALVVRGESGVPYAPTHWSFGQLATLSGAPAGYLRKLPAELAADCINYGMMKREAEDVGLLLYKNGEGIMKAATGPKYGRVWNADVVAALVDRFGDGITGTWKVPGEFGKDVTVTKANTTLYAGDRDMFVFLADEHNRIELPNRRNGQPGALARGFFMWNSEVGDQTLGLGTFFFDYVCCNRIVWGAEGYQEIKIRHTASAPDKFVEQIAPALETYRNKSSVGIVAAIEDARKDRLANVDDFLLGRFSRGLVQSMKTAHMVEEDRPIETRWDVVTAATAVARSITWQDDRVKLEREAGKLLQAA